MKTANDLFTSWKEIITDKGRFTLRGFDAAARSYNREAPFIKSRMGRRSIGVRQSFRDIFKNGPIMSRSQWTKVVKVSLYQLALPPGARREDIYESAQNRGLFPLSIPVGAEIRFEYLEQQMFEKVLVAIELPEPTSLQDILVIEADQTRLWISAMPSAPQTTWDSDFDTWIFGIERGNIY